MNDRKNSGASSGGVGFIGLLTIAFIVLKLCGVIKWSWLWVLSPIWIPTCFIGGILIVSFIILKLKK